MRKWVPASGSFIGSAACCVSLVASTGCGQTELVATEFRPPESEETEQRVVQPRPTLYAHGEVIRGRCGEPFVPRGVTEMVVWSEDRDGIPEFEEIAKTGANAVRIVWLTSDSASELEVAIQNAVDQGMVPLVEVHDDDEPDGDAAGLSRAADYWSSPEVVAVVDEYEEVLLLEIWGAIGTADRDVWVSGYQEAIRRIRGAGVRVPLIVDAPGWGDDLQAIVDAAPEVVAADALGNVILGTDVWSRGPEEIIGKLEVLQEVGVPVLITEFSGFRDCPEVQRDIAALLQVAANHGVGWFAWSWGGVQNSGCEGALDMAPGGTFDDLTGWGLEVAVTDDNSLSRTALPLSSLTAETCEPEETVQ